MKTVLLISLLLSVGTVSAQVTIVAHWRLGESDAGASAGGSAAVTVVNSVSASH